LDVGSAVIVQYHGSSFPHVNIDIIASAAPLLHYIWQLERFLGGVF
jgi:hypothetical protein